MSAAFVSSYIDTTSDENDNFREGQEEVRKRIGSCSYIALNTIIIIGFVLMVLSFVLFIIGVINRGNPSHDPLVLTAIGMLLGGGILSFTCRFVLLCITKKCCCFRRTHEQQPLSY